MFRCLNPHHRLLYSMERQRLSSFLSLVCLTYCTFSLHSLEPLCQTPTLHRYLLLSEAKIEKSKLYQFTLELQDSPVSLNRTNQGLSLRGNFGKLTLRHLGNGKETIYDGTQMMVRAPANHVFHLQRIPELQIQLNFALASGGDGQQLPFAMVSQVYMQSAFTSSISTIISDHINDRTKDGDLLKTADLIKLVPGFPMLMYRGSTDNYPCRNDIICFVKREHQLVSEQDLQQVLAFLQVRSSDSPKKAFKRKSLYQVYPIKGGKASKTVGVRSQEEQL